MNPNELERRMRAGECFHTLRLPPGMWAVLRVDGRGFTRFTETRFEKPFDERFHGLMLGAAEALVEGLGGIYAYTESDEISLLLPRDWDLFDRELEKAVSLAAGIASAAFTHGCGEPAHFDGRVWLGADEEATLDYFRWRQADAGRCALNGWCYWTLRKEGASVAEATRELERKPVDWKNELLFARGINFAQLPSWQRRGSGVRFESFQKPGVNPKTGEETVATRRRLTVDRELPMREEYDAYLRRLLSGA